jgi:hypothetical protein
VNERDTGSRLKKSTGSGLSRIDPAFYYDYFLNRMFFFSNVRDETRIVYAISSQIMHNVSYVVRIAKQS